MERYLPKLSEPGRRWTRFVALLVGVGLLVWLALVLRQVLTPIVAALALAYMLNPPVTWLERKYKVKRVTSIAIGLALLLLAGGALLTAGTAQVVQLAGNIPTYGREAFEWLDETVPGLLSGTEDAATETQPAAAPRTGAGRVQVLQWATEHGLSVGRSVVGYVGRIVSNLFYWLSLTLLLPLYTFFFLLRFNDMVQVVHDHLPATYRSTVVRVVTTIDAAISAFFRGRLIVCLIVGTLTGIGWAIVGVPYNLALGALLGALNLVPFLSVLALPPALLLTYFDATSTDANWIVPVILVLAVYLAVQAIESFALTPLISSKASGLHPITTVIALLIGGQLAGVLGMLLAIPIAGTLKSLAAEYLLPEVRQLAAAKEGPAPTAPEATAPPAHEPATDEAGATSEATSGDGPPSQDKS